MAGGSWSCPVCGESYIDGRGRKFVNWCCTDFAETRLLKNLDKLKEDLQPAVDNFKALRDLDRRLMGDGIRILSDEDREFKFNDEL